jgi:hypothetical protein
VRLQRANCIGEHALIERRTFNREGIFPLWRQVSGLHLRTIRAFSKREQPALVSAKLGHAG